VAARKKKKTGTGPANRENASKRIDKAIATLKDWQGERLAYNITHSVPKSKGSRA
jgi:hypothetical protein